MLSHECPPSLPSGIREQRGPQPPTLPPQPPTLPPQPPTLPPQPPPGVREEAGGPEQTDQQLSTVIIALYLSQI
ncbi:hypothetical protein CesoFtcFv8_014421 [Champsocephalus esox]|uniref:Uncharacterized protein n=1 Tax=Champsocephalus esox TaxID=159716 RepID=A0AAN8BNE2_9TELE|nr:hypothetical protein CesoFtcFv8_014421 [Champsocephalus esox]